MGSNSPTNVRSGPAPRSGRPVPAPAVPAPVSPVAWADELQELLDRLLDRGKDSSAPLRNLARRIMCSIEDVADPLDVVGPEHLRLRHERKAGRHPSGPTVVARGVCAARLVAWVLPGTDIAVDLHEWLVVAALLHESGRICLHPGSDLLASVSPRHEPADHPTGDTVHEQAEVPEVRATEPAPVERTRATFRPLARQLVPRARGTIADRGDGPHPASDHAAVGAAVACGLTGWPPGFGEWIALHRERLDGTGPRGLDSSRIGVPARMLAACVHVVAALEDDSSGPNDASGSGPPDVPRGDRWMRILDDLWQRARVGEFDVPICRSLLHAVRRTRPELVDPILRAEAGSQRRIRLDPPHGTPGPIGRVAGSTSSMHAADRSVPVAAPSRSDPRP